VSSDNFCNHKDRQSWYQDIQVLWTQFATRYPDTVPGGGSLSCGSVGGSTALWFLRWWFHTSVVPALVVSQLCGSVDGSTALWFLRWWFPNLAVTIFQIYVV